MIDCYNQTFGIPVDSGTLTRVLDTSAYFDCVLIDPCCDCDGCFKDKLPFIESDNFVFNFNFEVTSVKIIALDGTELADKTGTWKTGNKQITMFGNDTSGYDCFAIKVNDDCCLCNAYEKELCPGDTMLIESFYDSRDCGGNVYGAGYSNRMRIRGDIKYNQTAPVVKTDENGEVKQRRIENFQRLEIGTLFHHSGFAIRHLTNVILQGFPIEITPYNEDIIEFDSHTEAINKNSDSKSSVWIPILNLKELEQCENNSSC